MFEQQSSEQETPVVVTQNGELFNNYEVKTWELSPRIYKILGASALFNVLVVALFSQANILTMKGCESPFVGRVCQVLDTVYVSTVLFGTERDYVDVAYERIDLGSSDITMIDVSNVAPQLSYPEGYFQLANPEQFMTSEDGSLPSGFMAPGIPFGAGPSNPTVVTPPNAGLISRAPRLPRANPNAVRGRTPTSPFEVEGDEDDEESSNDETASANSNANSNGQVARSNSNQEDSNINPTNPVEGVAINRKPLNDFADEVLVKWAAKEVGLDEEFKVVLDGYLTKDGKLDPIKSKWDVNKQEGDPRMIEIGKKSLEALSQSGWLGYLSGFNVERINFVLVQNKDEITAVVTSSQRTAERAKTVASGLNLLISGGRMSTQDGSDEKLLLQRANVTTEGSNFVLNFKIAKPVAQEMINRRLKEAQARKSQQPTENGTATASPANVQKGK